MQISGVSLTLTWPRRLCLPRVLLCVSLCYKLSPFQAHWGRWHCICFLRPVCLFTAHVGSGSSPLSCGVFLPPPLLQAFPLLVAGHVLPLLPSPAGFVYLQFCEGFPSPPLHRSGHPTLFVSGLLLFLLLITQFLFFSQGGSQSVQGAMLIWPRVVCGSTAVPLSSPCGPRLPKPSGHQRLAMAWDSSWFLRLTFSGNALRRLEVWRGQSFASSQWFFL
jgi:hypothetical protein